jgi:hypothetical protein
MRRKFVYGALSLIGVIGVATGFWNSQMRQSEIPSMGAVIEKTSVPTGNEILGAPGTNSSLSLGHHLEKQTAEDFRTFFELKKKTLLTNRERETYRENLRDPQLITESRKILSAQNEKQVSLDTQELRMSMVEYLARALEWRDNPSRELVLRVSSEIINRDLKKLKLPLLLKKSLAGDQIELFQILRKAEPELAKTLQEQSQSGPNRELIAYAIAQEKKEPTQ